ncbi:hypothetical protein P7K49_021165, partial [Saguinus oedipus]
GDLSSGSRETLEQETDLRTVTTWQELKPPVRKKSALGDATRIPGKTGKPVDGGKIGTLICEMSLGEPYAHLRQELMELRTH